MSAAPLLGGTLPPRAGLAMARLRSWNDVTFDKEFLSSKLSRRTSWSWLVPLVSVLSLLIPDLLVILTGDMPFSQLVVDSFVVMSSFGLRHIPVESLKRDALVTTMLMTSVFSYFVQMPLGLRMTALGYPTLPFALFLMSSIGVHSIMIGVYFFVAMAFFCVQDSLYRGINQDGVTQVGVLGVAAWISTVAVESIIAEFYRELQDQRQTNSFLLKQYDCGFTVRSPTGVWETTDASVTEMLGGTLGSGLLSHVHPRDAAVVTDMLRHADRNIGRPIVATFIVLDSQFDAKVLIHRVSGTIAHMALTVVGEVRARPGTGLAAAAADCDLVPPQAALMPIGGADCDDEEQGDENDAVSELRDVQREPETQSIEDMWVRFDAGTPNFAIGEGSLEMCPGWLDWVPLVLRHTVESWVIEELDASDPDRATANARHLDRDANEERAMIAAAEAREPRVLRHFELRAPMGTVVARRAWVEREEPFHIEDGREVLSAVLHLRGSTVSEPHYRRQGAVGREDGAESSAGDAEVLDDSISIVNRRFLAEQP